ncbi:MAG: M24 family metallopeptidase, partial [Alistipes sp.]|nr:M24 family metallopeptidase [Alistipes sp.]
MIFLKTKEEIEILRENNILVSRALAEVGRYIKPGVTARQLNDIAEKFIRDNGAVPAFLGYQGYPAASTISINEQVVHGIPSDYVIKEGDV